MKATDAAYVEGLTEGRVAQHENSVCPYPHGAAAVQWRLGYRRGVVLRHFAGGTKSARPDINDEVKELWRSIERA